MHAMTRHRPNSLSGQKISRYRAAGSPLHFQPATPLIMTASNTSLEEPANPVAECCSEMDQYVRRHPGQSLALALGTGIIAALLIRALRPEPKPQQRLAALVADLEERLRDIGEPTMRKAGAYAAEGAHAVGDGVHRGEVRFERFLKQAGRRLRGYCS